MRGRLSRWLAVLVAVSSGACSFPDIEIAAAVHDGGTSTSTSSSAGGAGGAGSGGGTAGATGSGGAAGAGGSSLCDEDDDKHPAAACGGDDCDDHDPLVHPQQTDWFETERASGGFDYDCSKVEEHEFGTIACSGALCNASAKFLSVVEVACGAKAPFGDCNVLCQATVTDPSKTVRCH